MKYSPWHNKDTRCSFRRRLPSGSEASSTLNHSSPPSCSKWPGRTSGHWTRWFCSVTSPKSSARIWADPRERALTSAACLWRAPGRLRPSLNIRGFLRCGCCCSIALFQVGYQRRHDSRSPFEGAGSGDACYIPTRDSRGQSRLPEHVRLSCVQNEVARSYFRVDFQPENQGEGGALGSCWCRLIAPSHLNELQKLMKPLTKRSTSLVFSIYTPNVQIVMWLKNSPSSYSDCNFSCDTPLFYLTNIYRRYLQVIISIVYSSFVWPEYQLLGFTIQTYSESTTHFSYFLSGLLNGEIYKHPDFTFSNYGGFILWRVGCQMFCLLIFLLSPAPVPLTHAQRHFVIPTTGLRRTFTGRIEGVTVFINEASPL